MLSVSKAVFKFTTDLLMKKEKDILAEKLMGDVTDREFHGLIARKILFHRSKLDGLARKDLLASISLFSEGIDLLYIVSESARLSSELLSAEHFEFTATRKLGNAKKRFKEARLLATNAFRNEALNLDDRLLAMQYRLMATLLESIDNPTDALEACSVCLVELHQVPAVKECFKVELEEGFSLRAKFNKDKRRQRIFSVCRANRVVYDVMSTLGSVKRWTLPYVETGKEKVDPLRDKRVFKVLTKMDCEHCCVTPWALGQEGGEEHKLKDPRGITTNSKGHFLIADDGDKTMKVFGSNGKFDFRFNPQTDDAGTKLDILDVATAGEDDNIYLLVTLMKPGAEEWENEVQVFNNTADLQYRFPVKSGHWGRDRLTVSCGKQCGKILLLRGTSSGNVVDVHGLSGHFLCSFGGAVFKDTVDITATCDGRVMMVDRDDHNVYLHVFDVEGRQLGKFSVKHERDFYCCIACHPASDHVVLAGYEQETDRLTIAIYTVNGEFVRRMQLDEEVWSVNGITVTLEGHIAVAFRDKHDSIKVIVV